MSILMHHLRRVFAKPHALSFSNLRGLSSISQKEAFDVKAFQRLVLYEDQHILVVNKPTGMLSQGDSTNDTSMFSLSRQYLAHNRGKEDPTSVYLGLTHRLDRVSSGVLVLAKRTKAAARISEHLRLRMNVQKHYLCVVHGSVPALAESLPGVHLEDLLIVPAGSGTQNKTRVFSVSNKFHKVCVRVCIYIYVSICVCGMCPIYHILPLLTPLPPSPSPCPPEVRWRRRERPAGAAGVPVARTCGQAPKRSSAKFAARHAAYG